MVHSSSLPAAKRRIVHEEINEFIQQMLKSLPFRQRIKKKPVERMADTTVALTQVICLCNYWTSVRTTKKLLYVTLS